MPLTISPSRLHAPASRFSQAKPRFGADKLTEPPDRPEFNPRERFAINVALGDIARRQPGLTAGEVYTALHDHVARTMPSLGRRIEQCRASGVPIDELSAPPPLPNDPTIADPLGLPPALGYDEDYYGKKL